MMDHLLRSVPAGWGPKRGSPRRAPWFWLLTMHSLLAVMAGACGLAPGATSHQAEPTEDWVDVDLMLGPGDLDFTEMQTGLDALSGYKATLTMTFDGNEAGAKSQWTQTYEMLRGPSPEVWQLTVTDSDPATPTEFTAAEDGVYYEVDAEGYCSGVGTDPTEPLERPEPADLLTGVLGAEAAGQESLEGVAADHFTFDERALAQDGLTDSKGELWLATEGGYLLRYVLETQADESYFGEGTQGTLTWDYELSEINTPVALTLPPDCPPGMVDAPMMEDAADVVSVPGYVEYTTASNVAGALTFYETELAALGWTEHVLDASNMPGFEGMPSAEELAALGLGVGAPEPVTEETDITKEYILNDRILTVHIDQRDGVTYVTLMLNRAAQ